MKLVFKEKYRSINAFEPVTLPDFTVLTGFNGSGKTHLLKGIHEGAVLIDGIENAQIVYFNYGNFKLENEPKVSEQQITLENNTAWEIFDVHVRKKINTSSNIFTVEEKKEVGDACVALDRSLWNLSKEDLSSQDLYKKLSQYKVLIQSFFSNPPPLHLPNNRSINLEHMKNIFIMLKKLPGFGDEFLKEDFLYRYAPYAFKEDFLPRQIAKIFIDYAIKKENNYYRQKKEEDSLTTKFPALTDEEFYKHYGAIPWEVFNEILKTISGFKYEIPFDSSSVFLDRNYQLKLYEKSKNVEIDFDDLSSGERVLMALAACMYKEKADGHFPDVLLLDEIDASLHPSMIKNLLKIINDIFLARNMKVILATHSPTTVVLSSEESIFIVNNRDEYLIQKAPKEDAVDILSEGFITLDKGLKILKEITKDKVSLFSEGDNVAYLKKALELFNLNDINVIEDLEHCTGKNQLRTFFDLFSNVSHESTVFIVWDCDAESGIKKLDKKNNTIPFVFEKNQSNKIALKGIENLFSEELMTDFQKRVLNWKKEIKLSGFDEDAKKPFLNFILTRNQKDDFKNFEPLIEKIKEELHKSNVKEKPIEKSFPEEVKS